MNGMFDNYNFDSIERINELKNIVKRCIKDIKDLKIFELNCQKIK